MCDKLMHRSKDFKTHNRHPIGDAGATPAQPPPVPVSLNQANSTDGGMFAGLDQPASTDGGMFAGLDQPASTGAMFAGLESNEVSTPSALEVSAPSPKAVTPTPAPLETQKHPERDTTQSLNMDPSQASPMPSAGVPPAKVQALQVQVDSPAAVSFQAVATPRNTLESKLSKLQVTYEGFVTAHWQTLGSIYCDRQATLHQKSTLEVQLRGAKETLATGQANQEAAVESQDFELAAELEGVLEQAQEQVEQFSAALDTITQTFASLDEKEAKQTAVCRQLASRCRVALLELKRAEESNRDVTISKETARLEEIEDKLNSSVDINQLKLKHCTTDLEEIDQEVKVVEEKIYSETKESYDQKTALEAQNLRLNEELEELRRQLREKEAEIAECAAAIASEETVIAQERGKHEKRLKRIGERKASVFIEQQEAQAVEQGLASQQEELTAMFSTLEATKERFGTNISTITEEIAASDLFVSRLDQVSAENSPYAAQVEESKHEVAVHSTALETSLAEISTLRNELVSLETSLSEHHGIIAEAKLRLPALTASKAAAVRGKKYKDAARYVKEIKELEVARTNSEAAVTSLEERIQTDSTKLTQLQADIQDLEARVAQVCLE
jgi:chromosome segregation ATPase